MKRFKVKYLLQEAPAALVFPGIVVTKFGEVYLLESYNTRGLELASQVSDGEFMDVSEEDFNYAKTMYYSAVDTRPLLEARKKSPDRYVAIEDIIDTLPDRVEFKNNTK
jgi:hypothetical protein